MTPHRRFRLRLLIVILICSAGVYLFRRAEYLHPSRDELMIEVAQRGAVMGSNVRVIDIAPDGMPEVRDSGHINFIEVRFQ